MLEAPSTYPKLMLPAVTVMMMEIAREPVEVRVDCDFDTTDITYVGRSASGLKMKLVISGLENLNG